MRNFVIILAILPLLFASCNTEVDNYAEYKDITIVYALLEPETDTTWFKITKAFLGPGNALVIAREPDSSNYPGKLDTRLTRRLNNTDVFYELDTITIRNKRPGDSVFYFPNQLMYYTTAPMHPNARYTLEIFRGDQVVKAQTPIVKNFVMTFPNNFINFHTLDGGRINWLSAENGKRYEVELVFHYRELRPNNPDTLHLSMNWRLGTRTSAGTTGGESMEVTFINQDFYNRIGAQLDDVLNVKRWAGLVDINISVAADDFNTYIEVNAPSNSIVQEVPEFSNVENGIGILSSRYRKTFSIRLNPGSEGKLVEQYDWGFIRNP